MLTENSSTQIAEIKQLCKIHQAIILAHNYQNDEIQEIADYVGDSLALSQLAAKTEAKIIVFCGVHFMAESAAILAPDKKVLLPAPDAGCPMAEMAEAETILEWHAKYPQAAIVAYVNSSAAVKAVSDYCCTSANAIQLVKNIPETEIIFLPDQNLGSFVAAQVPEKTVHLWPGYCLIHHRVTVADVKQIRALHPEAVVLIHPECPPTTVALADFVGSTSQIMNYVKHSTAQKFIIGTEMGIIHGLRKENPNKTFYLLSQGLICPNMKRTTVEKVLNALQNLQPVITIAPEIQNKARQALDRMLEYL